MLTRFGLNYFIIKEGLFLRVLDEQKYNLKSSTYIENVEKIKIKITASIAQLVERPLSEREVVGSNPAAAPYQRCKNGTSSSLADARIKGVVLGR